MTARYLFRCPTCAKLFEHDEPGEPLCSGPSETRDEHPLEVMVLVGLERRAVGPQYGQRRAAGQLLMPGGFADAIIAGELVIARRRLTRS